MDGKKPKGQRPGIYGGRAVTGRLRKPCVPEGAHARYTLEVHLMCGPMPARFAGRVTSRTIEMLGSHTLEDLHEVIAEAFDRESDHLWAFYVGGKGFYDKKNKLYGPGPLDGAENAELTSLDDLRLKSGDAFGYRFDFGDDWQHAIRVKAIAATGVSKRRPRIVKIIGKSPPQFRDDW